MKYLLYVSILAPIVVGAGGCRRSSVREKISPSSGKGTPLRQLSSTPAAQAADNSRCHVCHMNFEDEELAVVHARNGVGCTTCHGESDAHSDDENNVTPPDIMYPKKAINVSCRKCHDPLAEVESHGPVFADPENAGPCTDCHGEHRMAYRTHRWNRKTGELITAE